MYLLPKFWKVCVSLCGIALLSHQQGFSQVPVTSGMRLHLDAATGFADNGPLPALWTDLSSANNDMLSGTGTAEPTQVPNAAGTGFVGILFDGVDDHFYNQTLNGTMSDTGGTIFIVRVSNNIRSGATGANYKSVVSIAEDSTWKNEMGLGTDWALHTTNTGNLEFHTHDCYDSIPTNLPVILSASFGRQATNTNLQIFGDNSLVPPLAIGTPLPYTVAQRRIILGARFQGDVKGVLMGEYFAGWLMEVIVYGRKLSAIEEQQVNEYLINKYYGGVAQLGKLIGDSVCLGEQAMLTFVDSSKPMGIPVQVTYTDGSGPVPTTKTVQNGIPFPVLPNPTSTISFTTVVANVLDACNLVIGGGSASTAKIVVSPAADADAGKDTLVCPNSVVTLRGIGNGSFAWSPTDSMDNPNIDTPTVTITKPTIFRLVVSNQYNCSDTDLVSVGFIGNTFEVNPKTQTICQGDSIELFAKGGHTFRWSPNVSISDTETYNPVVYPDTTTTYYVSILAGECAYSAILPVEVKVNPTPVAVASQSNDIGCDKVTADLAASGAQYYYWSPAGGLDDPSSPTPRAQPKKTTHYTVKVTNEFGCTDTTGLTVNVDPAMRTIVLPNAFTPNGDGKNDCYEVKVPFNFVSYDFKIFNRWGNCVFSTKNPMDCWNGENNGRAQDMGTYYYVYKIKSDVCGELTGEGAIHLIR